MALLTIEQARAQCRVDGSDDDALLTAIVESAEDAAQAYLNRRVYADAEALAAARAEYPDAVAAAAQSYADALVAAEGLPTAETRCAAIRLAEVVYAEALGEANACIDGIVVNASILGAIRLTVGHLYANREAVVIGESAVELPMGAQALLRPYRKVMMP